ncbi:MAG: dienelactone hydrolase family protein [Rhodobacteraceae bacterium]|nr:dienelactone hydrolase family protein [Paracoccaceae bacterium]
MSTLEAHRRGARSGTVKSLVIFVHGYGADGNDLISLSDPLGEHLPDTVFYSPDAPNPCKMSPMGREWFPIPWIDGSSEEVAKAGMETAVHMLNDFVDDTMKAEGVTPAQTFLVGFSQGTMMSLHIAPRRAEPIAGVVGFSGRLLEPDTLKSEVVSRPPVLLVHGDADEMVPVASLPEAANALTLAEFEVYTHISKGTGHGIAPDGLGVALQFIINNLPK